MAPKVDSKECRDLRTDHHQSGTQTRRKGVDRLFRQQMAASSGASWVELNPSLMATTVLVVDGGIVKSVWDCALAHLRAEQTFAGKAISIGSFVFGSKFTTSSVLLASATKKCSKVS